MELFLASVATAFNFIILVQKLRKGRYTDTLIDFICMLTLAYLLKGSYDGMAVAMMAGAFISSFLWFKPIILTMPKALILQRKTIKRILIFFTVALLSALIVYITLKLI